MNNWKITAIVFIILFVLQTVAFGGLLWYGNDIIKKEETCVSLCNGYDSYYFDEYTNVCECNLDGYVQKQMVIK